MCSDCEDSTLECRFCGEECGGHCGDPDTCPTCWCEEYYGELSFDDSEEFQCTDKCCCACHHGNWDCGILFKVPKHDPSYVRKGTFPFLELAGEIREKIYLYTMKADGNDRRSPNFRGTIQTAILYTCRQINKEARHIPLTINQLSFVSPLHALSFLGFSLAPTQKDLVTSMHIEIRVTDIYSIPLMMLLNEVAKMPITEFGVTLMGAVSREWFQGHTCFTSRFEILKNLKKFNLVIGSGIIKPKMKEEIAAHISKILVKGKTATPFGSKRKADKDSDAIKSIKPVKIAKTLPPAASSATQARSVLPKGRNGRIVYKPTRPALRTMRKDNEESKGPLLERYGQLEEYARSFDYAASSVRIRLEGARQAAEEGNQAIFEDLESGIMQTLEDHFVKIWRSRRKIPDSMKLPVF